MWVCYQSSQKLTFLSRHPRLPITAEPLGFCEIGGMKLQIFKSSLGPDGHQDEWDLNFGGRYFHRKQREDSAGITNMSLMNRVAMKK